MKAEQATKDSWQNTKMLESKALLQFERTFSLEEYQRIKLGLIPQVMEDKWFIYLEDDWLYFHRSWTGFCNFQLHIEPADDAYKVIEVWVNRDIEQYKNTDDNYDTKLLIFLIDRLLLGKDVSFPFPNELRPEDQWIYKHHIVGYGRSNDEEAYQSIKPSKEGSECG